MIQSSGAVGHGRRKLASELACEHTGGKGGGGGVLFDNIAINDPLMLIQINRSRNSE